MPVLCTIQTDKFQAVANKIVMNNITDLVLGDHNINDGHVTGLQSGRCIH